MTQEKRVASSNQSEQKKTDKVVVDAAQLQRLLENLEKLNKHIEKQISWRQRFLFSIVQGFGVVLGGSIVAYIIISLLVEALKQVNYIPFINMLFDSEFFLVFVDRLTNLQTQLQ